VSGPGTCVVCLHDRQQQINADLVAGVSLRKLAALYGMSAMALSRHKKGHLSPALVAVRREREEQGAEALVDRLESLIGTAIGILRVAEALKNPAQALAAIREARATLELKAKVTGELDSRPLTIINIQQSAEWVPVREIVYKIMSRHPEDLTELDERLKLLEVAP